MIGRRPDGRRGENGFTLPETLVATLLMVAVTGTALSIVAPAATMAQALPEAADMQQRARVALDAIQRDLLEAGAGLDAGSAAGSLVNFLPPIVPRRIGFVGGDAPGTARADAISLLSAATFAQTVTRGPLASTAPVLTVASRPGCPMADPLCGLREGSDALVFDEEAHFDVFRVAAVAGDIAELRHHDPGPSFPYPAGARVVSVTSRTYYFDPSLRQLRLADGYLGDAPVIDNVVGFTVAYSGDPNPPRAPRPSVGTANCLFDAAGAPLGGLAVLGSDGGSLAQLPLAMFADGPWCGEHGSRFDADLLRIRRVRLTLRVQAGPDRFRGAGSWFAVPGSSRRADQTLPDFVLSVDVTPRNLALAR
jgi:type II secretory pathway pseudopilin PulG